MVNKKDKFILLAKARVNKAIKAISLIGNLSNKSHYSYSADQVNQMMSALDREVKVVKSKFTSSKKSNDDDGFDFKK